MFQATWGSESDCKAISQARTTARSKSARQAVKKATADELFFLSHKKHISFMTTAGVEYKIACVHLHLYTYTLTTTYDILMSAVKGMDLEKINFLQEKKIGKKVTLVVQTWKGFYWCCNNMIHNSHSVLSVISEKRSKCLCLKKKSAHFLYYIFYSSVTSTQTSIHANNNADTWFMSEKNCKSYLIANTSY